MTPIDQPPVRVAIIDDEAQSRKTLRAFLNDYCPHVEVIGEADGVLSAYKLLQGIKPDAVFLDIQMNDGTGFDVLRKFPSPSFQVIFATAYDEFALKAFRANAVDYLLKPIDIDDLLAAVRKIKPGENSLQLPEKLTGLQQSIETGKFEKIALSSVDGLQFIDLDQIIRLESDGSYTTFFLIDNQKITVSKTIKNFDLLLPEDNFFRPHQSHLINLAHIKKIMKREGWTLLMEDNSEIPVSRSKKDELMKIVENRFLK